MVFVFRAATATVERHVFRYSGRPYTWRQQTALPCCYNTMLPEYVSKEFISDILKILIVAHRRKICPLHVETTRFQGIPQSIRSHATVIIRSPEAIAVLEDKGVQYMLRRLLIPLQVDTGNAQIESGPDISRVDIQRSIVISEGLACPAAVGECRTNSIIQ